MARNLPPQANPFKHLKPMNVQDWEKTWVDLGARLGETVPQTPLPVLLLSSVYRAKETGSKARSAMVAAVATFETESATHEVFSGMFTPLDDTNTTDVEDAAAATAATGTATTRTNPSPNPSPNPNPHPNPNSQIPKMLKSTSGILQMQLAPVSVQFWLCSSTKPLKPAAACLIGQTNRFGNVTAVILLWQASPTSGSPTFGTRRYLGFCTPCTPTQRKKSFGL